MSNLEDAIEYDDDDAVKYIQNQLPQELKEKLSEDQINYIIDIVYEYYETQGYMNDSVNEKEVVEVNEEDIVTYVSKTVNKDKVFEITAEEVTFVVKGELAYCESIGLFE